MFLLAALSGLGFFESAGTLGEWLDGAIGSILGWGKWIFPFILVTAGVFLFERTRGWTIPFIWLTGLGLVFVSLLGFFHLFQTDDPLTLAQAGKGGGYVGYMLVSLLIHFTGKLAGAVILLACLLIGVVAAFNLSLQHFFHRLFAGSKEEEAIPSEIQPSGAEGQSEEKPEKLALDNVPLVPSSETSLSPEVQERQFLEEQNIKHIRFIEEKKPSLAAPKVGRDAPTLTEIASFREVSKRRLKQPAISHW
ncbi:MAG: DNA translocase FtsK 4TM domain-containing protein, partial [candidate division Zixibacteria bacterium]|nr:DNA translocase FtsK 4TM domain-containing protein [candidate division Zixibacteria bacterium]